MVDETQCSLDSLFLKLRRAQVNPQAKKHMFHSTPITKHQSRMKNSPNENGNTALGLIPGLKQTKVDHKTLAHGNEFSTFSFLDQAGVQGHESHQSVPEIQVSD